MYWVKSQLCTLASAQLLLIWKYASFTYYDRNDSQMVEIKSDRCIIITLWLIKLGLLADHNLILPQSAFNNTLSNDLCKVGGKRDLVHFNSNRCGESNHLVSFCMRQGQRKRSPAQTPCPRTEFKNTTPARRCNLFLCASPLASRVSSTSIACSHRNVPCAESRARVFKRSGGSLEWPSFCRMRWVGQ